MAWPAPVTQGSDERENDAPEGLWVCSKISCGLFVTRIEAIEDREHNQKSEG